MPLYLIILFISLTLSAAKEDYLEPNNFGPESFLSPKRAKRMPCFSQHDSAIFSQESDDDDLSQLDAASLESLDTDSFVGSEAMDLSSFYENLGLEPLESLSESGLSAFDSQDWSDTESGIFSQLDSHQKGGQLGSSSSVNLETSFSIPDATQRVKITFELPEQVRDMLALGATPKKRDERGVLHYSLSQVVTLFSPQKGETRVLGEIINEVMPISPKRSATQRHGLGYSCLDKEERLEMIERRLHIERRRQQREMAKFSPRSQQAMVADLAPTQALKQAIVGRKVQFLETPTPEVLSQVAVRQLVRNVVKVSKELDGFDRVVLLRDRTLERNGRSLKRVILQNDEIINLEKQDDKGRTNLQRMRKGLAPWGPDNKPINLHHLAQTDSDALAELTADGHLRWGSMQTHYKFGFPEFKSRVTKERKIQRQAFDKMRRDYWSMRAQTFQEKHSGRQLKITDFFKKLAPKPATQPGARRQLKITDFFSQ